MLEYIETNVIKSYHDNLGHLGVEEVIENIFKMYLFPQMHQKMKILLIIVLSTQNLDS